MDYVRRLYKEACIEDCVGWLDPANNKAFLTSQISCTNNAYSIMVSAKRDLPDMGKVIDHGLNPKGPTGQRYHALVPVTHGVFAYGQDVAGRQGLPALDHGPEAVTARGSPRATCTSRRTCTRFDKVSEWDIEPRVKPFQKVLETGKLTSWPAPANRAHGDGGQSLGRDRHVLQGLPGAPTKTVIAEAVTQLKQIYG